MITSSGYCNKSSTSLLIFGVAYSITEMKFLHNDQRYNLLLLTRDFLQNPATQDFILLLLSPPIVSRSWQTDLGETGPIIRL